MTGEKSDVAELKHLLAQLSHDNVYDLVSWVRIEMPHNTEQINEAYALQLVEECMWWMCGAHTCLCHGDYKGLAEHLLAHCDGRKLIGKATEMVQMQTQQWGGEDVQNV